MISPSPALELIVPMGQLMDTLNCQIQWKSGSMELVHPVKGDIPVQMKEGCLHLARTTALELIAEIEDKKVGIPKEIGEFHAEVSWMKQLVQQHAVLASLPAHVQDRLVVEPGPWSCLPGNNTPVKGGGENGIVAHLYAGPDSGFTLRHAVKQLRGSVENLVEVDILRGDQHDMLADGLVYSGLLRAALEGKIHGIIAGPHCRTEEFGIVDATPEELRKLHDDDIMLWRAVFLYMICTYMRRVRKINAEVAFTLEQPASPREFMPEVVSFWDTTHWKEVKREFAFQEYTVNQGSLGGLSPKPCMRMDIKEGIEVERK